MNKTIAMALCCVTLLANGSIPSANAAKSAQAKTATTPSLPKILTGLPTNISVRITRCIRANVPEFGSNNVVVLQYQLKKEGANKGPVKYFDDARFTAIDIKARDPALGQSFTVIRSHEQQTYSDDVDTANWKVGQTGDGYAWLKVPERVQTLDIFFPKTAPVRVNVEVPRA